MQGTEDSCVQFMYADYPNIGQDDCFYLDSLFYAVIEGYKPLTDGPAVRRCQASGSALRSCVPGPLT